MNKGPWIHALAAYKRVWSHESKVNFKQSKPTQEDNSKKLCKVREDASIC